jgi:hypothetical protein
VGERKRFIAGRSAVNLPPSQPSHLHASITSIDRCKRRLGESPQRPHCRLGDHMARDSDRAVTGSVKSTLVPLTLYQPHQPHCCEQDHSMLLRSTLQCGCTCERLASESLAAVLSLPCCTVLTSRPQPSCGPTLHKRAVPPPQHHACVHSLAAGFL